MGIAYFKKNTYVCVMFIRQIKKRNSAKGKVFFQYQLVQNNRIDGKVRQRIILYLGSDALLNDKDRRKKIGQVLRDKIFERSLLFDFTLTEAEQSLVDKLFEKYQIKYPDAASEEKVSKPPKPESADFEMIDLKTFSIEQSRTFGGEYLCRQVMQRIGLEEELVNMEWNIGEARTAMVSIISRALFASSEHKTEQYLRFNSSLNELYGFTYDELTRHHLYKISDKLYEYKDQIDRFLYRRLKSMFNLGDKIVIYDLSNTYFEGSKRGSKLAKYGRSKEKRNDCKQVVFTGVINSEGFIRHSRIYEGNKADSVTMKDMLSDLKRHTDSATVKRTVVMDAGIATEENLAYVVGQGLDYVCVSRRRLKDYEANMKDKKVVITDNKEQPIELAICTPEGENDTWMYVQSEGKRLKESSMQEKLSQRFEEDLEQVRAGILKKGGTKSIEKVWERIGRLKEKNKRVSAQYKIEVKAEQNKATEILWSKKVKSTQAQKSDKENGVYFIRTSCSQANEQQIWETYNTVREVEATFRCLKTDLQIRPVFHQKDERIESHIYSTILAYQLVNSIRFMLKNNGLNYDWRNILRIMNTQTLNLTLFTTPDKKIALTKPAKPIQPALQIYKAAKSMSMMPQKKKYVVYH